MAELEIIKHLKTAYKTVINPSMSWKHKLKEIFIEVLIIVFAITVSMWFHNWSDKRHEHHEEREFLAGLQKDLQLDIENASNGLRFYRSTVQKIQYLTKTGEGVTYNNDSLNAYVGVFFSNTLLQPQVSRYEALKNSSKFDIISNKELLNNIINLHEAAIKRIETLNEYYFQYVQRISAFIQEHGRLNEAGTQIVDEQKLLQMPQMRFMLLAGMSLINGNIIAAHTDCIQQCNNIIKQIDEELK